MRQKSQRNVFLIKAFFHHINSEWYFKGTLRNISPKKPKQKPLF